MAQGLENQWRRFVGFTGSASGFFGFADPVVEGESGDYFVLYNGESEIRCFGAPTLKELHKAGHVTLLNPESVNYHVDEDIPAPHDGDIIVYLSAEICSFLSSNCSDLIKELFFIGTAREYATIEEPIQADQFEQQTTDSQDDYLVYFGREKWAKLARNNLVEAALATADRDATQYLDRIAASANSNNQKQLMQQVDWCNMLIYKVQKLVRFCLEACDRSDVALRSELAVRHLWSLQAQSSAVQYRNALKGYQAILGVGRDVLEDLVSCYAYILQQQVKVWRSLGQQESPFVHHTKTRPAQQSEQIHATVSKLNEALSLGVQQMPWRHVVKMTSRDLFFGEGGNCFRSFNRATQHSVSWIYQRPRVPKPYAMMDRPFDVLHGDSDIQSLWQYYILSTFKDYCISPGVEGFTQEDVDEEESTR